MCHKVNERLQTESKLLQVCKCKGRHKKRVATGGNHQWQRLYFNFNLEIQHRIFSAPPNLHKNKLARIGEN